MDVNEENQAARGFYEALGFVVVGRSPLDETGRPHPLLHLRREVEVVNDYFVTGLEPQGEGSEVVSLRARSAETDLFGTHSQKPSGRRTAGVALREMEVSAVHPEQLVLVISL